MNLRNSYAISGLLVSVLLCPLLHAQNTEAQAAEEALRRADQQQRVEQEAKDFAERAQRTQAPQVNLPRPPPASQPIKAAEQKNGATACFDIRQIRLEPLPQMAPQVKAAAEKMLSRWWLGRKIKAQIEPYQNTCMQREQLIQLQQKLQEALIDRGYTLSQVVIPEQDLSSGQILLYLIPGVIETIDYAQDKGLEGRLSWSMPTQAGRVFNLRDVEQGLEQIKRLPSQDVQMELLPGSGVGQSNVVLQGKKSDPMRLSWTTDNAGSESTGVYQGGLSYSWDNPLNINDLLTVSYNRNYGGTEQTHGTRSWSLSYLFPSGYWNHSLNVSGNEYWQQIESLLDRYRSSGQGDSTEWKSSYLFYRDQGTKLSVQGRLNHSTSKTFLRDVHVPVQDKNLTSTQWDLIWKQGMTWGNLDLTYSMKRGLNVLDSNQDDLSLPPEQGTYFYSLHLLDANLAVPLKGLGQKWNWNIAARAQSSESFLYAANQFGVGGRYTVRGYELGLAAENGLYVRQDFKWQWRDWLNPYLGLDYGEISGHSSRFALGKSLSGGTIGASGQVGGFQYDVFWSRHIEKPFLLNAPDQGVYGVQLSYQWAFGG